MLENMLDTARPLTKEDIRTLEQDLSVSLPESYQTFLLRYNGGLPAPDAFPIEGMPKNPYGTIQEFYGIDCPIESSNLKWNYQTFITDSPRKLFPIACTQGPDQICLCLWGDDAGAVVFWDSYAEHSPSSYANVYGVARNFDEFIDKLFRVSESKR